MQSHTGRGNRARSLWIGLGAAFLASLAFAAGCAQPRHSPIRLDLSKDGQHVSGDWTYTYSITNPGTRSQGCHGVLSYREIELPAPLRINDYYETPWGRLYWVGKPVVLFGAHGWMPTAVAREPMGQALIDPAIVHSDRFLLHVKLLAPEELGAPDRLERDARVLAALKTFGLTEAHVQGDWFPLGADPITLHDTKRWGTLAVSRADRHQSHTPILEFTCTGDLTVNTTPKPASLDELMAPPAFIARPHNFSLSPQADALQPIQCTLSPVIGDPLVLYLVCRIEDQGPKPPWKVPVVRQREGN